MAKIINPTQLIKQLIRAVRLVWQAARQWTLINILLIFIQGTLPLVTLYLLKLIVDTVTVSINSPDKNTAFLQVGTWILIAAGVALMSNFARSLGEYASESQGLIVTDYVANILHAQSVAVDLEYYEDSSYYDTLHRAQKEAPYRPTRIVNGLIQAAQNGLSLLGIVGLLITFNWAMALILLLAALPGAFVRIIHSRRLFGLDSSQTEKERRSAYFHNVLVDVQYAKELRLLNLGDLFQERYTQLKEQIRTGKLTLAATRVRSELIAQTISTAALFGSLAWISWQTVQGLVTLGDLMVYYLGFQSGLTFMQSFLRSVAGLYEDSLFLTNLYTFLDIKPKIIAPVDVIPVPSEKQVVVSFNNVSFTYPSREKEALKDINLTIAPGEVIAIIGENGSGKTTLIKLLCRLYDPSAGEIKADGVSLPSFNPIEWQSQISVTFQDFARYNLSVRENIWLGNVQVEPEDETIEQAGRRAGADSYIRRLPQGYDTMLGHWFKRGQELSGGEWQKIALARMFWRNAKILVMDEPTSALDPLAEAELFNEFRALLDGRSAILISHRFSTVQMADRIYVMELGRIIEQGTHAELMANKGHYAHLYHTQAQHYQED